MKLITISANKKSLMSVVAGAAIIFVLETSICFCLL